MSVCVYRFDVSVQEADRVNSLNGLQNLFSQT